MHTARPTTHRFLAPALAAACACVLAGLLATAARAEVYGGLGRIGAGLIKPGVTGGHGQINPFTEHGFVVNPSSGAFYLADEIEEAGKNKARIQAFGPKGEFLAENRVAIGGGAVGGLAVDPVKHKLYLLVKLQREAEDEKVQKAIEKKETEAFNKETLAEKREKEGKTEEAKKLRDEAAKLREEVVTLEEELPVRDPEFYAASEVVSFSTEVSAEKLGEEKILVSKAKLEPASEAVKGPLVAPAGIAVDPKTHDVVLLGQQDESKGKGSGEEELRAVVERVHEKGELGPRYVDTGDCLDDGIEAAAEPACGESVAEQPHSPIVTPQGKVYVEAGGNAALWEIPTATESGGGFKEISSQPKRVFALSEAQKIVFAGEQEVANTMAFAETVSGQGRIYASANIEGTPGLLVLNWVEKGEGAEVTERGWTGGQEVASKQELCVIPPPSVTALVGAFGETGLVFDSKREIGGEPGVEAVFGFGLGAGAEACGHVEVTAPRVELVEGGVKEAKEVPAGSATKIISQVVGANAEHTKWKIHPTAGGAGDEEAETGYQFRTTSLNHTFLHAGEYEITEEVQTDNLGTGLVTKKLVGKLIVAAPKPKVKLVSLPSSATVGIPAKFEAEVTDENEATPHLKYTWKFGDGSAPVEEAETAPAATTKRKVEHAFIKNCGGKCKVVVEVADGTGSKGSTTTEVSVTEAGGPPPPPPGGEGNTGGGGTTTPAGGGGGEVLPHTETHNPEAKIAGASLGVSKNGAFPVKISCPAGQSVCTGTITLRTLNAVSAKAKKAILTLASGSFSVAGGQTKTLTLHLSAKAMKLLKKNHTLRALASVVAHDSAATRTTKSTVTLRLLKRKH